MRNQVAPDYLVREFGSNHLIAVERMRLREADLAARKNRQVQQGADIVVVSGPGYSPREMQRFLSQALAKKLERRQLEGVFAHERVLLVRNESLASAQTFLGWRFRLDSLHIDRIDRAFLIASSRLLQLW